MNAHKSVPLKLKLNTINLLRKYKASNDLENFNDAVELLINKHCLVAVDAPKTDDMYEIEDDKLLPDLPQVKSASLYAIEDHVDIPPEITSRCSAARQRLEPVIKQMKAGQSIVVKTQHERDRFVAIMHKWQLKYNTRSIYGANNETTYRCWVL